MKKVALLVGVAVLAFTAVAFAANPMMIGTKLTAKQDHATASHGKGTFTGDIAGGKLKFTLKFSGLTGPASAAHIHMGSVGKAGPVIVASGAGTVARVFVLVSLVPAGLVTEQVKVIDPLAAAV